MTDEQMMGEQFCGRLVSLPFHTRCRLSPNFLCLFPHRADSAVSARCNIVSTTVGGAAAAAPWPAQATNLFVSDWHPARLHDTAAVAAPGAGAAFNEAGSGADKAANNTGQHLSH